MKKIDTNKIQVGDRIMCHAYGQTLRVCGITTGSWTLKKIFECKHPGYGAGPIDRCVYAEDVTKHIPQKRKQMTVRKFSNGVTVPEELFAVYDSAMKRIEETAISQAIVTVPTSSGGMHSFCISCPGGCEYIISETMQELKGTFHGCITVLR